MFHLSQSRKINHYSYWRHVFGIESYQLVCLKHVLPDTFTKCRLMCIVMLLLSSCFEYLTAVNV